MTSQGKKWEDCAGRCKAIHPLSSSRVVEIGQTVVVAQKGLDPEIMTGVITKTWWMSNDRKWH